MNIPLSIPNLAGNEMNYLKECIETNFVSSVGKFVSDFECEFAKFVGSQYAVAMSNGTAALHIALEVLDIGEGDDVLAPNLTFVAPLNAIRYTGANPVLVDSEWETLGMCPDKIIQTIEELYKQNPQGRLINKVNGNQLKAIMPMHTLGNSCLMDEIIEITGRFNLKVIEDASESLGARYKGRSTGVIGDIGCFSFNGNKIITSGGGGMFVTDDEKLAKKAKHLSTTAKIDPIHFIHDSVGYNYRMVNLLAAVGLAQLEQIEGFLKLKRDNFLAYKKQLASETDIFSLHIPNDETSNYWFYSLVLKEEHRDSRDQVISYFLEKGIQVRPIWALMETLKPYEKCQRGNLECSRDISSRIINIPCSTSIAANEIDYVCDAVRNFKL